MSPTTRKRLIGAMIAGVVLAFLAGAALLPLWIDTDALRPIVQRRLTERLGREVTFSDLDVRVLPLPTLTLTDLVVAGASPGAEPWVEARALRVRVRLRPLLSGRIEVVGLAVDEPTLRVLRAPDGSINLLALAKTRTAPGSPGGFPGTVHVRQGRVVLLDAFVTPGEVRQLELGDLDVAFSGSDALRIPLDVSARLLPSGGEFAFDGIVGAGGIIEGRARLAAVDLAALSPWLEPSTGMANLKGRVSCDLVLARRADTSASAKGSVGVEALALPIASRGARPIDANVQIDAAAEAGGRATFRRLDLASGATSIALSGSVQSVEGRQLLQIDVARSRVRPADLEAVADAFGQSLPLDVLQGEFITLSGKIRTTREGDPRRLSRIAIDGLDLEGGRVVVRRDASGTWALAGGTPAPTGAGGVAIAARNLRVRGLAVRLEDPSSDGLGTLEITDVSMTLASLDGTQPGPFDLAARVAGGRLAVKGRMGAAGGESSFDVAVEGARLAELRPVLSRLAAAPTGGILSWTANVHGRIGEALAAKGRMTLAGATLLLPSGDSVVVDMPIDHDVRLDAGGRIVARSLVLGLPGGELRLRAQAERGRLEVATDGAASLSPAALRWLLGLAGPKLPFGLEADAPVELDARVVRAGEILDVSGRIGLSRARLSHALLPAPLEIAQASVTLDGDRIAIDDAALRLGRSLLAGSLAVEDFDAPRLTFDLRSPEADLDELFAFTGRAGDRPAPAGGAPALADRMRGAGRLRIARATFGGLLVSDFDAGVSLQGRTLRIDPATLALYDGTARARAGFDLGGSRVGFDVDAAFEAVDIQPLLAAGLGYSDITGRGRATAHLTGHAGAVETAIRSLEGAGDLHLRNGVFRGLNALEPLRKAGVFGEQALAGMAERLSRDGTPFESLSGRYGISGGVMTLTDLVAVTPDADIRGGGTSDLATRQIDLDVIVVFSEALSGQMRAEGSRAAGIFWDDGRSRVVLPARLKGPLASPKATIDWGDAAARLARRRLTGELGRALGGATPGASGASGPAGAGGAGTSSDLRGALDQLLGRGSRSSPGATGAAGEGKAGEAAGGGGAVAAADGAPRATIDSLKFGGSMLAPDLRLRVTLIGTDLSHASVTVSDPDGRVIKAWPEAFRSEVDAFRASAPPGQPASIPGKLSVDGALLLASRRVVVTVRPVSRGGAAGPEIRQEIEKSSLF